MKNMKKKKEVKSKVQWPHWELPFQPGSNLRIFVKAMSQKQGLTVKVFLKLIKKTGASPQFQLKCMRSGKAGGWTWNFDDSKGRYRITNIRLQK